MLRKISLLALLLGGSVGAHAHELLLRGGADEEVATYNFEAEDVDKQVCSEYFLKVCCDDVCQEGMTKYESSAEVRDAKVCTTMCLDEGGSKCSWSWRATGCSGGGGGQKSSIRCTKPRPGKVKKEGIDAVCANLGDRDVPYKCDDESKTKLCCTESDMEKVTFKNKDWGECEKMGDGPVISNA